MFSVIVCSFFYSREVFDGIVGSSARSREEALCEGLRQPASSKVAGAAYVGRGWPLSARACMQGGTQDHFAKPCRLASCYKYVCVCIYLLIIYLFIYNVFGITLCVLSYSRGRDRLQLICLPKELQRQGGHKESEAEETGTALDKGRVDARTAGMVVVVGEQ